MGSATHELIAFTIDAPAIAMVTLLLALPPDPLHVTVYIVSDVNGGVVYEPDVVLIPAGVDEHDVLLLDDQVITAFELYATIAGVTESVTVVVVPGVVPPGFFSPASLYSTTEVPPHATKTKLAKIAEETCLDILNLLIFMI